MNTKPRAKHTIDSLLARTVEVGDCMEWQGLHSQQLATGQQQRKDDFCYD